MDKSLREKIENCPIITAVKDDNGLAKCLDADSEIVFVLYGDIINIKEIVDKIKNAGKLAFVHIDLIQGLQSKEIAVDFIKANTSADGIISTKGNLIKRAKELKLYTIMRFFLLDSLSFENIEKQTVAFKPDIIEILPAPMPKVVKKVVDASKCPVIAGGLISEKDDVMAALEAGASCISSTNPSVWDL